MSSPSTETTPLLARDISQTSLIIDDEDQQLKSINYFGSLALIVNNLAGRMLIFFAKKRRVVTTLAAIVVNTSDMR